MEITLKSLSNTVYVIKKENGCNTTYQHDNVPVGFVIICANGSPETLALIIILNCTVTYVEGSEEPNPEATATTRLTEFVVLSQRL